MTAIGLIINNGGGSLKIRKTLTGKDAAQCLNIYNYYIENSTATFEETPLSETEFLQRVQKISSSYPYLVAEENGIIVGYAYISEYNSRSAYRFTADLSIYILKDYRGREAGSLLLSEIEKTAGEMGIKTLISIITEENNQSLEFSKKHGFECCGKLKNVGYKFNRWLGVYFYSKSI